MRNNLKAPGWVMAFLSVIFLSLVSGCQKGDNTHMPDSVDLQLLTDNLVSPLTAMEAPDLSHRLFIVDQVGKVWIVDKDGQKMAQPFMDITSKLVSLNPSYDERGLLGFAFHP